MTAAVWGLAATLLTVVGGVVTVVLTRKPNSTESQVANDGSWEKLNKGWMDQATFFKEALEEVQADVIALKQDRAVDVQWKNFAVAYIRSLLAWGHAAGADSPPDPPTGLVIPDE